MTSTAFQEGPHFQDIEIYKGAYNLYTIQKKRNSEVFNIVEIYSLNCLSDISFSSERIDVGINTISMWLKTIDATLGDKTVVYFDSV